MDNVFSYVLEQVVESLLWKDKWWDDKDGLTAARFFRDYISDDDGKVYTCLDFYEDERDEYFLGDIKDIEPIFNDCVRIAKKIISLKEIYHTDYDNNIFHLKKPYEVEKGCFFDRVYIFFDEIFFKGYTIVNGVKERTLGVTFTTKEEYEGMIKCIFSDGQEISVEPVY